MSDQHMDSNRTDDESHRFDLVASTRALLETLPPAVRYTPEAVYAVQLAATVSETSSARDVATVGKELRLTLDGLRAAALNMPERGDRVDELRARRAARAVAAES